MQGGLARRAAYIDKARSGERVFVVDTGRFCSDPAMADREKARAKSELMGRAYRRMGMSAVNVSDWELAQGLTFLKSEADKGLPLISANLLNSDGKRIFPAYVIKKADGVKIAFIGLMRPEINHNTANEKIIIKNPAEAARSVTKLLKGKADIIIMLSDMGAELDKKIASKTRDKFHLGQQGWLLRKPETTRRRVSSPVASKKEKI